jgi:hypothetical protein
LSNVQTDTKKRARTVATETPKVEGKEVNQTKIFSTDTTRLTVKYNTTSDRELILARGLGVPEVGLPHGVRKVTSNIIRPGLYIEPNVVVSIDSSLAKGVLHIDDGAIVILVHCVDNRLSTLDDTKWTLPSMVNMHPGARCRYHVIMARNDSDLTAITPATVMNL